MAFVYLDGLTLKVLREGIVRETVYVALGVTPFGERQVLGFWPLPTESALGWEGVLRELWQRGLRRVLLFITDRLPGLPEAIRRVYPEAEWQRCVVHGVRWGLCQVRALDEVKAAWGSRYPRVVGLWVGGLGGLFAILRVPQGPLALLTEHQSDGEVHLGSAGDECAGPQVSQGRGSVQAFVPGVGEAGGEVGGEEA